MAINYVKRIPRGSEDEYEQERKRLREKFQAPLNDESNAFIQSAKRGETPRTYQGPPPGYYERVNGSAQANPSSAPVEYAGDSAPYSAPEASNPSPVNEDAAYGDNVPDNYSQIDYAPRTYRYEDYDRDARNRYEEEEEARKRREYEDAVALYGNQEAYSNSVPDNYNQSIYGPTENERNPLILDWIRNYNQGIKESLYR